MALACSLKVIRYYLLNIIIYHFYLLYSVLSHAFLAFFLSSTHLDLLTVKYKVLDMPRELSTINSSFLFISISSHRLVDQLCNFPSHSHLA